MSGLPRPFYTQLKLNIPFTISSNTTTITGTIINLWPYIGGSFLCNGNTLVGLSTTTGFAKYIATVQRLGQPAQTISGSVQMGGNIYIQPRAETTITETLAFP